MKRYTRMVMLVISVVLLIIVSSGFQPHNVLAEKPSILGPVVLYTPECSRNDPVCAAWTKFRRVRPYPYQTFAAQSLADGALVIIISEPAPVLAKADVEQLIKAAFGSDLLALKRLRWKIGIDGWVEDLVLKIKSPLAIVPSKGQTAQRYPLDDPLLRDRIALLHLALFGTPYGGGLELIGATSVQTARSSAPDLHVSAKELHDWLLEPGLVWQPIDRADTTSVTWTHIAEQKMIGAFASADSSLIMLTFPTDRLIAAQAEVRSLDSLRADFRRFAVASDAVLGGVWTPSGQMTVLARARTKPLDILPPLRFETFALLAAQSRNELQQSYERTNLFAGKMMKGEYKHKDWAPIYLSEPLIDTEFGALLNITDQMLKSWSEAGSIEYIYFTYPFKPDQFPFTQGPLSQILQRETGTDSVLFNWNTTGSAVVAKLPNLTVLAAKQTGALPITYGAELKPGEGIETGHLLGYEEQAYKYFAGLKDPNLARVVQYTLIYQLFRAAAMDLVVHRPDMAQDELPKDLVIKARAASTALLVAETTKLLVDLESGQWKHTPEAPADEVRSSQRRFFATLMVVKARLELREFQNKYPKLDHARLARLLVDPQSEQAEIMAEKERLEKIPASVRVEAELFARDRKNYSEQAQQIKVELKRWFEENEKRLPDEVSSREEALHYLPAALRAKIERLDAQKEELMQRKKALQATPLGEVIDHLNLLSDVTGLRDTLSMIVPSVRNLDTVRRAFIVRNAAEPKGWIKTPSVVISWNRQDIASEGGHNLKARALRLEPAKDVSELALVETERGLVLRYNPSRTDAVAAKATELARAVEHGNIRNVKELGKLLEGPVETRMRLTALELPPQKTLLPGETKPLGTDIWEGRLGQRLYSERKPFIDDLRTMAEKNDCCIFIVRDRQRSAYMTEVNAKPPPSILIREARDTSSLNTYMKEVVGKRPPKPIIFLDQSPESVQALTVGLEVDMAKPGNLMQFARRLGARRAPDVLHSPSLTIKHIDLEGRPASLRVTETFGKTQERTFLSRLMDRTDIFRPKQAWANVQVSVLEPKSVEALVQSAGWNSGRDGIPTAVMVSFGLKGPGPKQFETGVVAGFKREHLTAGKARLLAAHEKSLKAASDKGATVTQHFMTLKNELQALPELQLKRLMFVVQEGETDILFSRLELIDDIAAHL